MKVKFLITLLMFASTATAQLPAPQPVAVLDLDRYAGQWHENAALPNRFQRDCARDTTAHYRVLSDRQLEVRNRCTRADGTVEEASGRARPGDRPGTLKVAFANLFGWWLWPFAGDYWVLAVSPDYRWAVVGHPELEYGWVLARDTRLQREERESILEVLRAQGYDPCALVTTPHPKGELQKGAFCQSASAL